MIERELARLLAAVLAGEPVAIEHCLSGEAAAHYGPLHHVDQADYRRRGEQFRDALYVTAPVYDKLRLASPYQDQGASHVADVEWLVILVKHQNRRIDCAHSTPYDGLVCQKLLEAITPRI